MAISNLNFAAQIDAWTKKTAQRTKSVLQESVKNLIADAETVGPSVKNPDGGAGGKMPVDTGYLWSSIGVSYDGMPSGPGRGDPKQAYSYDETQIVLKLADVEVGKTIYVGWVANYAIFAEERYGFCRSAAMNWQVHVSNAIEKAKAQYP